MAAVVDIRFGSAIRCAVFAVLLGSCASARAAGTTTYSYDALGRLIEVNVPASGAQAITRFQYDNAGNRVLISNSQVDTTAPDAPTGLTAQAQAYNWIRLTWTASQDVGGGPVALYKIYRGGVNIASVGASPYDDHNVVGNTPYSYTISAVDPTGNESAKTPAAGATTPPPPDVTAPSVPSALQAAAVSGTWINLSWGASTDTGGSGLAGYEIFRNGGASPVATSAVASFADQYLQPGASYSYTVRAYDQAGNRSAMSNQAGATTPDVSPPSAPGVPTFSSIATNRATASWTAASDNVGVTAYRYSPNGTTWTTVGNSQYVILNNLSAGSTYGLYVQASDAAGNWGPSSFGYFMTLPDSGGSGTHRLTPASNLVMP